jgi:hypothetical protein
MAQEQYAHIQNVSTTDEVRVLYSGSLTVWAPQETKIVPVDQSSFFVTKGFDLSGNQVLKILDEDSGGIELAKSEVAAKQRDVQRAKDLLGRATEALTASEKQLKIAIAKQDALIKEKESLGKK